jgi:hypothetical protein
VTTQKLVAFTGCEDGTKNTSVDPPTVMNLDRSQMLLVAGGGDGGYAGSVRSGGNGGNAGARADFGGEAGSDGNHGDISNCNGHGGGGASTAPGGGGPECDGYNGQAGHGFYGGGGLRYGITPTLRVGAGGAGGGGWYGGGASSNANAFQCGGGRRGLQLRQAHQLS